MKMIIKNGRVLDPSQGLDEILDICVNDGVIDAVGRDLSIQNAEVIDATGLWVAPGLVDIHVHLRQPGYEYKETIESGTHAAVVGGFTSVACMANTNPVCDNTAVVGDILAAARAAGWAKVYPIGAVSEGLAGEDLSEIGAMAHAGCVAFSDDGKPVASGRLMRLAMVYAHQFGKKIISHAEDLAQVAGGVMNEGDTATRMGLKGTTRAAEESMIARDLILSQTLNIPVHIAHVSTRGGVALIREAKARGTMVTAETAPHYLTATDSLCENYDTNAKVNPPLRTEDDCQALMQGLLDGTIDCIACDHAPHHADEKLVEFDLAASGISGIETSLALSHRACVEEGGATPLQWINWMSTAPARVFDLPAGTLRTGAAADITLINPNAPWEIDVTRFVSKGHNNPFHGQRVGAVAAVTIVDGKLLYRRP